MLSSRIPLPSLRLLPESAQRQPLLGVLPDSHSPNQQGPSVTSSTNHPPTFPQQFLTSAVVLSHSLPSTVALSKCLMLCDDGLRRPFSPGPFSSPGGSPDSRKENSTKWIVSIWHMWKPFQRRAGIVRQKTPQKQKENTGHMTPCDALARVTLLLRLDFKEEYCWVAGNRLGRPGEPQACSRPLVFACWLGDFRSVAQVGLEMTDGIHLIQYKQQHSSMSCTFALFSIYPFINGICIIDHILWARSCLQEYTFESVWSSLFSR